MNSSADARDLLRRSGLRVTAQRRAILDAFRGGIAEHLSADEVHARASAAVPEIGRGTVYATLAELTELGLLGSVGNPEPVRYEINLGEHDHFRCRLCLRLFDVELGGRSLRDLGLTGFTLEHVAVVAEGVCAECHDYERGLAEAAETIRVRPLMTDGDLSGLACARVQSPVGELALAASGEGIVRVAFFRPCGLRPADGPGPQPSRSGGRPGAAGRAQWRPGALFSAAAARRPVTWSTGG